MTQEEAMGLAKDRRKLDINEEYYVSVYPLPPKLFRGGRGKPLGLETGRGIAER